MGTDGHDKIGCCALIRPATCRDTQCEGAVLAAGCSRRDERGGWPASRSVAGVGSVHVAACPPGPWSQRRADTKATGIDVWAKIERAERTQCEDMRASDRVAADAKDARQGTLGTYAEACLPPIVRLHPQPRPSSSRGHHVAELQITRQARERTARTVDEGGRCRGAAGRLRSPPGRTPCSGGSRSRRRLTRHAEPASTRVDLSATGGPGRS